jgi:hypothetical protein
VKAEDEQERTTVRDKDSDTEKPMAKDGEAELESPAASGANLIKPFLIITEEKAK